jgi:hypothetical protein
MKIYMVFTSIDEEIRVNRQIVEMLKLIERAMPVPTDVSWKLVIKYVDHTKNGIGMIGLFVLRDDEPEQELGNMTYCAIQGCSTQQFIHLLASRLEIPLFVRTHGNLQQGAIPDMPSSVSFWNEAARKAHYKKLREDDETVAEQFPDLQM